MPASRGQDNLGSRFQELPALTARDHFGSRLQEPDVDDYLHPVSATLSQSTMTVQVRVQENAYENPHVSKVLSLRITLQIARQLAGQNNALNKNKWSVQE